MGRPRAARCGDHRSNWRWSRSTSCVNQWHNRFFNALQEYNWDVFVREIGVFCVLASCAVVLAVYQLYLNQWLQIRWRRWLTRHYLGEWMHGANHYRMQLQGDAADNPDQRIADDVKLFVERTLDIGLEPFEFGGDAAFLRHHPVGPVGSSPLAPVRQGVRHPRLPGLGRADLRRPRHGADAMDRLAVGAA